MDFDRARLPRDPDARLAAIDDAVDLADSDAGRALARALADSGVGQDLALDLATSPAGHDLARTVARSGAGQDLARYLAASDAGRALARALADSDAGRDLAWVLGDSDTGRALAQDLATSGAGQDLALDVATSPAGRALARDLAASDAGLALARDLAGSTAGQDLAWVLGTSGAGRDLARYLATSNVGWALAQNLATSPAGRELALDLATSDAGRELAQNLAATKTGQDLAQNLATSDAGRELARYLANTLAGRDLAQNLAASDAGQAVAQNLAASDAGQALAENLAASPAGRDLARNLANSYTGRNLALNLAKSGAGRALATSVVFELTVLGGLSLWYGLHLTAAPSLVWYVAGVACRVDDDEQPEGDEDHSAAVEDLGGEAGEETRGAMGEPMADLGPERLAPANWLEILDDLERVDNLNGADAGEFAGTVEPDLGLIRTALQDGTYADDPLVEDLIQRRLDQLGAELRNPTLDGVDLAVVRSLIASLAGRVAPFHAMETDGQAAQDLTDVIGDDPGNAGVPRQILEQFERNDEGPLAVHGPPPAADVLAPGEAANDVLATAADPNYPGPAVAATALRWWPSASEAADALTIATGVRSIMATTIGPGAATAAAGGGPGAIIIASVSTAIVHLLLVTAAFTWRRRTGSS